MNTYNIPLAQPQPPYSGMQSEPLYNINYSIPYYQQSAPAPDMPSQPQYAPSTSQPQYAPSMNQPQYAPSTGQPQYPIAPMNPGSNPTQSIPVAIEVQNPPYILPGRRMNSQQRSAVLRAGSTFVVCPHCHSQVKTVVPAPKWVLIFFPLFFIFFITIFILAITGNEKVIAVAFPVGFFAIFFFVVCMGVIPNKSSTHKCPQCDAVLGRKGDVVRW